MVVMMEMTTSVAVVSFRPVNSPDRTTPTTSPTAGITSTIANT